MAVHLSITSFHWDGPAYDRAIAISGNLFPVGYKMKEGTSILGCGGLV